MIPILSRLSGVAFVLLVFVTAANAKQSCAVVGDSIAVGAGQYVRACKVNAKIGIVSSAVVSRVNSLVDVNVVSAGSNDPTNPNLQANLEKIRSRARRVIWILPIELAPALKCGRWPLRTAIQWFRSSQPEITCIHGPTSSWHGPSPPLWMSL